MNSGAESRQGPPLWTWLAAVGLAMIVLGGLALFEQRMAATTRSNFFGLSRLQAASNGLPTIVIIGSSRTRCAIEADDRFAARLRTLGVDAKVVRITRDRATAVDLPEVFEAVIAAAPQLVVIEADMVVFEPNVFLQDQATQRVWQERVRATLRYGWGLALSAAANENRGVYPERGCAYANDAAQSARVAERQRILATRRASSDAEKAPYLTFVRALAARGTPTLLLRLFRRPDHIGAIPVRLEQAGNASRAAFLRQSGARDLGEPVAVAASDYHDAGHMKPSGKARTSAWLARRLAAELRGRPQ